MLHQAPKHVNANSSFVSHLQYAVKYTSLEVHKKKLTEKCRNNINS